MPLGGLVPFLLIPAEFIEMISKRATVFKGLREP